MAFGDQDLDIFFVDGTKVVLADGSSFMAHFDIPEKIEQFGAPKVMAGDIAGRPMIRFNAVHLANINHGDLVTINSAQYKIRSAERDAGDGLVAIAQLGNP